MAILVTKAPDLALIVERWYSLPQPMRVASSLSYERAIGVKAKGVACQCTGPNLGGFAARVKFDGPAMNRYFRLAFFRPAKSILGVR